MLFHHTLRNLTVDLPDAGSERGKIPKECTDTANGARMKKEPGENVQMPSPKPTLKPFGWCKGK